MNRNFSNRYQAALLNHLKVDSRKSMARARGWGQQALEAGLQTLGLAKLHEHTLVTQVLPHCPAGKRVALIKKASNFFSEAITPIENTHSAREAAVHLNKIVEMLSRRTVELAASNLSLQLEISQRKTVEKALKKSQYHYTHLLENSDRLQERLRQLSRQILSAQEDERKEISRELHDVIAQTLTGINVRLATLAKQAVTNTKGIDRNIAKTQRLVEQSVEIVHRFARELRPAVLDDLGLIPALHSYLKNFTTRTGVRSHLKAFKEIEQMDSDRRTVMFRVAQEALTNIARHARASQTEVVIQKLPAGARMEIRDNGISFNVDSKLNGHARTRLGLLGMRERVEMVGGTFCVESAPGRGTTVRVEIPFARVPKSKLKDSGKTTLKCP